MLVVVAWYCQVLQYAIVHMGHLDHRRIDFVLAATLLGLDFIPFMWQTECVCQASRFVDLVVGGVQLRCYVIHLPFLPA